jgi:hypothetical protein
VADIICGRDSKYEGSIGTGVAKVNKCSHFLGF